MKKIRVSLLTKVVIAIAAGVLFGQFLPGGIARIFVTFNSLFGNFLSFSIPLIILGLVTPAIGDLGKGVKKVYQTFLQAGMKDVSCKLYKNDRHEILNETDREQVYADLLGWMKKRIK